MQSAHFLIWCGIAILIAAYCVLVWYVRKLWLDIEGISKRLGAAASELESDRTAIAEIGKSVTALQTWATSYAAFHENASRQYSARVDDLNGRLIQIETENKTPLPKKHDDGDDPLGGPRSWSAVASSIERSEGVRI
jgi:hypothetical protein